MRESMWIDMSLDERLKDLTFHNPGVTRYLQLSNEEIESIKQAFIAEGWKDWSDFKQYEDIARLSGLEVDGDDCFYECERCGNHVQEKFRDIHNSLHTKAELPERMTGSEWYERFDKEMRGDSFPYRKGDTMVRDTIVTIRKAARRASGVDHE